MIDWMFIVYCGTAVLAMLFVGMVVGSWFHYRNVTGRPLPKQEDRIKEALNEVGRDVDHIWPR